MIFQKKITPSAPRTPADILRSQLQNRIRHRSTLAIAADLNDIAVEQARRDIAHAAAGKLSDDPGVATSLARGMINNFPADVGASAKFVTDVMLDSFLRGAELPDIVLARLAEYFSGGHGTIIDGQFRPTRAHQRGTISGIPPAWQHPDPAIAQAQAALHAAIAAATPR